MATESPIPVTTFLDVITISKIEASDYFKNQSQKSAGVSVGLQHAKNQRSKKVRRHLK